jgi:hypothetical protein
LQAAEAGHILHIDFLQNFIIAVAPKINQVLFYGRAAAAATAPSLCVAF